MKANTTNYISFPSGKACLLEDQEVPVCECYYPSGGSSSSNGSTGCCVRDIILPTASVARSHLHHLSTPTSKHTPNNSITSLWNALKFKRAKPSQPVTVSSSSGEHSRSSSFKSNTSNSSSSKYKAGGNTSFSICRALRKSVPKRLKHKSKSDNCLYKIDASVGGLEGRQLSVHDLRHHRVQTQISQDSDSGSSAIPHQQSTNRFTRKVFDLTNAISARVHPSNSQAILGKSRLKKTRSLEKDFPFRVQPSVNKAWSHRAEEECKRRTRSLERNHRYLVTLDSSCRYSREVGSTQVNLDLLPPSSSLPPSLHSVPNIINIRERADLRGRYQPDPTFKPPIKKPQSVPGLTTAPVQKLREHKKNRRRPIDSRTRRTQHNRSQPNAPKSTMTTTGTSIVSKPARGWLHPDHLFAQDGVNYAVRYIGSLEVNTSMKVLDFDTRSAIAKECINRICQASGAKSIDSRRRADRKVVSMLGEQPSLAKATVNVQLTITSLWLKLSDLESGEAMFIHDMPNISFASGGDVDTLDYVAYVAKDKDNVRSCYVLECAGGLAQEVITTIGQAFELRFKEFLKRAPEYGSGTTSPPARKPPISMPRLPKPDDVEYYNDLPEKRPPPPPLISPAQAVKEWHKKESTISNLIDFNTEITRDHPEYVNDGVIQNHQVFQHSSSSSASSSPKKMATNQSHRDPFDMSPFSTHPPCGGIPSLVSSSVPGTFSTSQSKLRSLLQREEWYHGPISRREAEMLLQWDGDFLVRESQGSPGQYVLTGMQNNSKKHLLLVDPQGIVRTKDREFESVSHLIAYHRDNNLPIISAESALRLKRSVVQAHH